MSISRLNQAILLQLCGLTILFAVHRPYNLLGWAFIVGGGVLYRRELKRRKLAQHGADPEIPRE